MRYDDGFVVQVLFLMVGEDAEKMAVLGEAGALQVGGGEAGVLKVGGGAEGGC